MGLWDEIAATVKPALGDAVAQGLETLGGQVRQITTNGISTPQTTNPGISTTSNSPAEDDTLPADSTWWQAWGKWAALGLAALVGFGLIKKLWK